MKGDPSELSALPDDANWDIPAYYLAQVCLSLIYTVSVERIIIGGGLLKRKILYPKIRALVKELNREYVVIDGMILHLWLMLDYESLIIEPNHELPGVVGSLILAEKASKE